MNLLRLFEKFQGEIAKDFMAEERLIKGWDFNFYKTLAVH